jgi:aspartate beta-hydroxylase
MAGSKVEATARAREWLLLQINKRRCKDVPEWQRGCPDIVPGLRANPWWPETEFPWFKAFEDNFKAIQAEVLALRAEKGFQPYRGPSWISGITAKDGVGKESVDSGQWNVFYLFLHDIKF